MALIKDVELENGVVVNYHRITSINNVTNNQTTIEVSSYTSAEKRQEEKDAIENEETMNVFIETTYFPLEYHEDMTISEAYDYLKTTHMLNKAKNK